MFASPNREYGALQSHSANVAQDEFLRQDSSFASLNDFRYWASLDVLAVDQFGSDRRKSGHASDVVNRSKLTEATSACKIWAPIDSLHRTLVRLRGRGRAILRSIFCDNLSLSVSLRGVIA